MTKFFRIEDRLKEENRYDSREMSPRAEMLRLFRDVLEDKTIDEEKAKRLLDKDFAKDVNFKGYTDELLLLVFFRETLAQLKLRSFIEKDILQLSSGGATFPC